MAVKQKQSQKQNVNVNINLGEKKKKGKPKRRKTGKKAVKRQTQTIINPAPIINYPPAFQYNQPNNWFNPPPPIPQKQYAVLPEEQTAPILGLLSNVPVPLRVEGNPLKEELKEPKLKVAPVDENLFAPSTNENLFTAPADVPYIPYVNEEPSYYNLPSPNESSESLVSEQEEDGYKTLTEKYKSAKLPVQSYSEPSYNTPSPTASSISSLSEPSYNPPSPTASSISSLSEPSYNLPSPSASSISLFSEPSYSPPSPSASTISTLSDEPSKVIKTLSDLLAQQAKPQPKVRKGKSEQQKAEEARQQEEIFQMRTEEKQQKAYEKKQKAAEEKAKPLIKQSLARFIESGGESLPLPKETKKKGAPLGPRPQTYETIPPAGYAQMAVPIKALAEPIPAELTSQGAFTLSAPLAQQPSAELQPKITFLAATRQPAAEEPAKEKDPLQKERKGDVKKERRVIQRAEASVRYVN